MDRIHIRNFRSADHRRHIQIALRGTRRSDADGLVGKARVQRVPIRFAVNRHRAQTHFFARADHAQRDFAAIGDKNFTHGYRGRTANSAWPYSTGCPFCTSRFTTSPAPSLSISFISFIASTMHNTVPTST